MGALEVLRSYKGKTFSDSPSPFMHWLKPIVVEADHGSVVFEYLVRHEWTNPMGILHGGVTAAIIDDVIGATMFSLNEEHFYTTLNNVIDYFSTAAENDNILAETRIIKKGKQIVHVECEIWNSDKTRLIARGHSNLLKTNLKKHSHS